MTRPDKVPVRAILVRYFRWLRKYGLNDSHSGNASCRDGDTVWITPTGCCADILAPDDLLPMQVGAAAPAGTSLDASLHLEIYRRVPGVTAVLHSHGPCSIATTMEGENFEPQDFEGQYYFERVPVLTIPYEAYVDKSPAVVSRALVDHRIAVVRGHGVYARGETIDQAYKWTCSLESSARIAWLARVAGTGAPT